MLLYIRHGKDEEDKQGNDGGLLESAKEEIKEKTFVWIKEYDLPDIIYYSPFYRTFQTVKQIKKALQNYMDRHNINKKIKYIVEPKIGRYVTSKEQDIRYTSLNKGAIIGETSDEFKARIKEHLESVNILKSKGNKIWNVTHAYILTLTAKYSKKYIKSHLEYLDTLVIN